MENSGGAGQGAGLRSRGLQTHTLQINGQAAEEFSDHTGKVGSRSKP